MNILQNITLYEYRELVFRKIDNEKLSLVNEALSDQFFNHLEDFEFIQNVNILKLKCKIALDSLEGKKNRNAENQLHLALFTLQNHIKLNDSKQNNISEDDFEEAIINAERWYSQRILERETTLYRFMILSKIMKKEYKKKIESENRINSKSRI